MDGFDHEVDHLIGQGRVDPDPECAMHDDVGVGHGSDGPMGHVEVRRLAHQVAAEELAGGDAAAFEVLYEVEAGEGRLGADGDGEAEPTGLTAGRRLWEDQVLLEVDEPVVQALPVTPASSHEPVELVELGDADGSLHVGGLEVVAKVAVRVLVVVAAGEFTQLPVEALAARVVVARGAPAVAAPVPETLDDLAHRLLPSEHGAALAHGDVVGRIEARRGEVAKGADGLAVPSRADGVAGVLDHPEIVLIRQFHHDVEVEGVAQGVRHEDRTGPRADGGAELVWVGFVGTELGVDEDRYEAVLEDRIDRGREAGGDRDDLVTLDQPVVLEPG